LELVFTVSYDATLLRVRESLLCHCNVMSRLISFYNGIVRLEVAIGVDFNSNDRIVRFKYRARFQSFYNYAPIAIACYLVGSKAHELSSNIDQITGKDQANCGGVVELVSSYQSYARPGDPSPQPLGIGRDVEPFSWKGIPETAHQASSGPPRQCL
jgi:hypothetical protein